MKIKVNVERLGYRPGDTVSEGDRYYETFKKWADNEDRKGGSVICEFTKDKKADPAPPAGPTDEELVIMRAKAVHNMKNDEIIMLLDLDHGIKSPEGVRQKDLREAYKTALDAAKGSDDDKTSQGDDSDKDKDSQEKSGEPTGDTVTEAGTEGSTDDTTSTETEAEAPTDDTESAESSKAGAEGSGED